MIKVAQKKVIFVGSALENIRSFPEEVRSVMGHALYLAQLGQKAGNAKPLKGFKGASVLEIVDNYHGDAFRAVYTVEFKEVLYVLHAFQKKSRKGIATPQKEIDLIYERLKKADEHYKILTIRGEKR